MKRNYMFMIGLILLLISCGGSKEATTAVILENSSSEIKVPIWYINPPMSEETIYSPSTATSKDMQLAINKASTDARAELGRVLESKINALQKKFDEETGLGENSELLSSFTQATKIIVATTLQGSKISKQEIQKEGTLFRAYILMEFSLGAAKSALLQQIKQKENLYTKFRASETFKELDKEVEKFEEYKKNQGN